MSLLADRNRRALSQNRGGLSLYDPAGKVTSRPSVAQQPSKKKRSREEILRDLGRINEGGAGKKDDDEEGLAEKFFGTTIGAGLGKVLNNPIAKGILQPLDILGVPQRAIASTIQEGIDLARGNGFSAKDWIDQVNPDAFWDGNQEGSIGMGDVWRKHSPLAGKNPWADAAVGLVGDIATDPFTLLMGVGVADKGLDALRAGSRLGAAARKGEALGTAASNAKKVRDGATTAAKLVAEGNSKAKGTARSLMGRNTRLTKTSEGTDLIEQALRNDALLGASERGTKSLDALYGEADIGTKALADIRYRAKNGLGARMSGSSDKVTELVETALNIKGPAVRMRVPKVPFVGARKIAEIPGSQGVGQALQTGLAKPRSWVNDTALGRERIKQTSVADYEKIDRILTRPDDPGVTREAFRMAAEERNALEAARPIAGKTSVFGQRMSRSQRKQMQADIAAMPGKSKADKNAAYIAQTESKLVGNNLLNKQFKEVRKAAREDYGITIPEIDSELAYVPHVDSPEMRRYSKTEEGRATAGQWDEALGRGVSESDLLAESGRMKARVIGPNMDLPLPGAPGKVFNTGDGSIAAINANAKQAQFDAGVKQFRILEDTPIKLLEDYIQAISEDVGRRAGRANQIAQGSPDLAYNYQKLTPAKQLEVMDEARAAYKRVGIKFDDAEIARIQNDPRLAAAQTKADMATQARKIRKIEADGGVIKDSDMLDLQKNMGKPGWLIDQIDMAAKGWTAVGENMTVLMDPKVQEMMRNIVTAAEDPGRLMRLYSELNKYFKNFAVLTPGFHIRNGMSAVFMNIADGVPVATTTRGVREWSAFSKATRRTRKGEVDLEAARDYIKKLREEDGKGKVADALEAVMGSGAGGRFTEAGIAQGAYGKVSRFATENRLARKSQDAGAFVEGSVRMGMALDTLERGSGVADAVSRITRVHFDYSQTSRFDDKMKKLMPFYSFLSRNIPLQIAQQWSRPKAYLGYEKFKENFEATEENNFSDPFAGREGEIPGYIEDGGGIRMNLGPFGNWFEPDLPHTRVFEDIERYSNILNDPAGATSGFSPVITAPAEYAFGQDLFTGQKFADDDWEHISNPLEVLQAIALLPTGNVKVRNGRWSIKTKALNALQSIDPLQARASRLTGSGGQESERTWEAIARTAGFPFRNITDKQMRSAAIGRSFDEADMRAMERELRG